MKIMMTLPSKDLKYGSGYLPRYPGKQSCEFSLPGQVQVLVDQVSVEMSVSVCGWSSQKG